MLDARAVFALTLMQETPVRGLSVFECQHDSGGRGRGRRRSPSPTNETSGLGRERGRRVNIILPATGFYIDPSAPKDENGQQPSSYTARPDNCPVAAGVYAFIRFENMTPDKRFGEYSRMPSCSFLTLPATGIVLKYGSYERYSTVLLSSQ